ncbi:hypothetical protein RSAG8_13434, partial [Rhizoctonia solani AG-8 WAC10335]
MLPAIQITLDHITHRDLEDTLHRPTYEQYITLLWVLTSSSLTTVLQCLLMLAARQFRPF